MLGVLPGLIGTIQATETIKLLTGIGEPLTGRMLHVDTRTMRFRELKLRRDPDCPACGERATITAPAEIDFSCALPAPEKQVAGIGPEDLETLLASPPSGFHLLDVREKWEHLLTHWSRATQAIPFTELSARLSEVPAQVADLIVVCSIGERSVEAVRLLEARGFPRVRHLKGGLRDLPSAGDEG